MDNLSKQIDKNHFAIVKAGRQQLKCFWCLRACENTILKQYTGQEHYYKLILWKNTDLKEFIRVNEMLQI